MELDHQTVVAFSKSWGLFYLLAFSAGVVIYAMWPANRARFARAKTSILENDDRPGT